jgi:adenosylmethionine---8-amino-7-oxononanoate aminotransferase
LREGLAPCRKKPGVVDVRVKGAIGAVQLESLDAPKLRHEFAERGFWIRPFGDIVYLTPAFTIEESQLGALTAAMCALL